MGDLHLEGPPKQSRKELQVRKRCFVISPIGKEGTDTRRHADNLLKYIIEPALQDFDYDIVRADLVVDEKQTIPESITEHVINSDLVIADLTDLNPNVFYELGMRHVLGGHCVHLTSGPLEGLPFDVRAYRAIHYALDDPAKLHAALETLRQQVTKLRDIPPQLKAPLTPERLVALSGATLLMKFEQGRREHYYRAAEILRPESRRIFLMQRSSSLILGPESEWEAEVEFYRVLLERIREGSAFYHVVSLEGIRRHLAREQSTFPAAKVALSNLAYGPVEAAGINDAVGIPGKEQLWLFRKIREDDEIDIKPDRQARVLIVEYREGSTEGVIVVDFGGRQFYFHLRGKQVGDLMHQCIDFYNECHLVRKLDVESLSEEMGSLPIKSWSASSRSKCNTLT